MLTLDIIRATNHTTFLLHLQGQKYPAEIKNYAIRQALMKTDARTFSVEMIKGWREMLKQMTRIDILKKPYIHATTEIVNKMIDFFENFK